MILHIFSSRVNLWWKSRVCTTYVSVSGVHPLAPFGLVSEVNSDSIHNVFQAILKFLVLR